MSYHNFNFPQSQLPNQTQPSAPFSLSALTTTLEPVLTSTSAPSLAPSLPSAPAQGLASTPAQALTASQAPAESQAPADTSVLSPHSMAQLPPAKMSYHDFNFPQPQLPNQTQPSAPSSLAASTTTLAPALTSTPAPSLAPSLSSASAQGLALSPAQALTASQAPTESQAPADTSVLLPVREAAPSIAPSNSTCIPEPLMYKNRLQEYAQKSGIQLPVYHTINEGFQHSPMFRSTVYVDGAVFTSPDTFSHRKTAEQSAAKIALDTVLKKMKDEGCPLIYVDVVFCKSILNEFAVKMNMEKPTYNTIRHEGQLSVFVSSLSFNGILYTGDPGKNKKEAEQLAARAVIMSLLVMNIGHNASTVPEKDKGVEAAVVVNAGTTGSSVQPVSVNSVPTSVDSAAASVVAEASSGNHRPHHEFRSVKSEPFPEVNIPNPDSQAAIRSIEFVHAAAEQPTSDSQSSGKRRRRNRRKANKRMRTNAQLSVATLPLNQAPACSVAQ
ncbi:double-stranded RNA-binding protein 1 isoform X3 [Ziziphus jujuba]|uniref:Double-stranded RNA-binding protein 1 isoform X3 n=1 Tax=Ziziphus jujuba TaxID=326968 RepID=A0ABM3IR34_ZIZJJ|nr:double-stranded RNA-binding protein 1 isoform X3 [Ziziphus jujuba]